MLLEIKPFFPLKPVSVAQRLRWAETWMIMVANYLIRLLVPRRLEAVPKTCPSHESGNPLVPHRLRWAITRRIMPPNYTIRLIVIIIFLLPLTHRDSQATDISVNGYYKNFFVAYDAPRISGVDPVPTFGSTSSLFRLHFRLQTTSWSRLDISYNLISRVQHHSLFVAPANIMGSSFPVYRFADFANRLYPQPGDDVHSFGLFHNLDRALLTINTAPTDILIGRQAIAWGSARVVNPTDLLAPFSFDELDTEDRRGVDALRLRTPLGVLGELDAGYVPGHDFAFERSAFFLRGKFYTARTDLAVMLIWFREKLMFGLDVSRSLGGAGLWWESAYVFTESPEGLSHLSDVGYFRTTIGADYALTANLYGFVEYHFSQAGTNQAKDYLSLTTNPAFTDGAVFLMGRHYLIPGFSYQITPLFLANGQLIFNLTDPSVLFAPQLEYNIVEDIYLDVGVFIGLGPHPIISNNQSPEPSIRLRSEFGGYADIYFFSFRFYF